jgi:hypothetical protein
MVKYVQALSVILLALLTLTLVSLVIAYRTPEYRVHTVSNYRVEHIAEVSYNASVKSSLLYGNRSSVSTGEPLYTRLVKELNICFVYNIVSSPPALNSKYEVTPRAVLGSESWNKVMNLEEVQYESINQTNGFTACIRINFTKVLRDIAAIEKEIGVRQDKHNITIIMDTSIETLLPNRTLRSRMSPTVTLQITGNGRTYVITKNLKEVEESSTTLKSPTTVNIMGLTVPTSLARSTLLPLSIILGITTAISVGLLLRQGEEGKKDIEEILKERLKGKLIKGTVDNSGTAEVTLHDIEDFITIANEHRNDVIYDQTKGKYYVIDLNTIYSLNNDNLQLRKSEEK